MTNKRAGWITWIAAGMILVLVLGGCGGNNGDLTAEQPDNVVQEQPDAAQDHIDSEPKETNDAADTGNGNGEPADEPVLGSSDSQEDGSTVSDEGEVAKAYHMNKNFFIKPNEEDGEKKVVLLTFDDGPKERDMLTSMLDTLDKHNAKAIFFVNGYRVKANPELLQLIDERGQIVGNHSYDHIVLSKQTEEKIDQQLEDVQTIVEQTIGKKPQFFRPPNGAGNDYIKAKVKELGMLYMTWSNGSLDWDKSTFNKPQAVIDNVMKQLAPGSNILMHELPWTAEALDELLTKLEEAGYGFVDPRAVELEAR